ncbi:T9SS type A sorting domain-containing protein [bacterium]|nr:T9SS type A sorting domain-containing protein [bacterium]
MACTSRPVLITALLLMLCAIIGQSLGAMKPAPAPMAVPTASPAGAAAMAQGPAAAWQGITRTVASVPYADGAKITFANGYEIDTRSGDPDLPAGMKYETPKDGDYTYYIVQFRGPIRQEWRTGLEAEGAQVMFYLPNYAFVVRMTEEIRARLAATKGEINWTGLYHPAYKISDRIAARTKGGMMWAQVLLFGPERTADIVAQIEALVGRKTWYTQENEWAPGQWDRQIYVEVGAGDLPALSRIRGVCWVEPMHQDRLDNMYASSCVQRGVSSGSDTIRPLWRKGITGQGQVVLDLDSGCRPGQQYFIGASARTGWYWDASERKVVAQQPAGYYLETLWGWTHGWASRFGDEAAASYHGTHTSGSICGKDTITSTNARYNGMAPDARLCFVDGEGDSGGIYGTYPPYVGAWGFDSLYLHTGLRTYISSNSYGDSSVNGEYDAQAAAVDQFMWSHKDFLFFYSDGNDGAKTSPGCKAGSPGTNKNGVAVGALADAQNAKASYSSYTKNVDGRINPTVCTPGGSSSYIISANGGSNSGTQVMQGTSMACPVAAGACALARQYYTEGWYPSGTKVAADGFVPSAALLKATMIISGDSVTSSSGRRSSGFSPSDSFGFGRVNLDTALYFSGDSKKMLLDDNRVGLLTGESQTYLVNIPSGATDLRAALVWTDYPGSTTAALAIVNNLDLFAYEPGDTNVYRGNRYTASTIIMQSTPDPTTSDTVNVMEGVKRVAPVAGLWRITVTGANVAYGPQPYALVVTYRTTTTATMGKVYLDKQYYSVPPAGGSNDTLRITVADPNRTAASCNVRVSAKLVEAVPETVALAKVGDGLYQGKVPLWLGNVNHGDGILSVSRYDTITALFTDDDPAFTDTARAYMDWGLTISNIRAVDPAPPNATQKLIQFATSEQARSKIYYGLTTALGSTMSVDTPLVSSHSVKLTGLAASTTYYYDVEATDYRGNTVRDNNGGRHYQFSTGSSSGADVLVVVLNDDLQGEEFANPEYLTRALTSGGWSYDWWSTKDQGIFTRNQLRKYKAVFFQVGQENYPAFNVAQRETIKLYHMDGGRFSFGSHDCGWDTWLNTTNGKTAAIRAADTMFCRRFLHFTYKGDITATTWTQCRGVTGDPISGSYAASPYATYTPYRDGAAGDSILTSPSDTVPGTGSYVWSGSAAADSCGIKWASTANLGTPGVGVWGGYPTRVVYNGFEITQVEGAVANSAVRTDILNKLFIWLIGHDHPKDTIRLPVAGTAYSTSPVKIKWNSYVFGGAALDTTWIEYSSNGGNSWNLISKAATYGLTDSINWDISSLANGPYYQVRVRVSDKNVHPSMSGSDTVGNFTINRSGGDNTGPLINAGTLALKWNPVCNVLADTVTPAVAGDTVLVISAVASDSSCGLSPIAAAKCSINIGGTPYVYTMSPGDGSFNSVVETVRDTVRVVWTKGNYKLYVMAADNSAKALRWGVPDSTWFTVTAKGALSVTMSMMDAWATDRGIAITWRTESENNSYKWQVERSEAAAGPYAVIAELAASNTSQPHTYDVSDPAVRAGVTYYYRIVEVDQSNERTEYGPLMVLARGLRPPDSYALAPARPNPFGNKLEIQYQLPTTSAVHLAIYNITGQKVRTLQDGAQGAGYYSVAWDGRNQDGKQMANGVYFYKLSARADGNGDAFNAIRKATLLK